MRTRTTQAKFSSCGSIAQLGEHLPYKQRVTGSSPVVPTKIGPVVQLVRTLACHARGRRFEPVPGRQFCLCSSVGRAEDWKSSCRWFDSVRRHQYADVAHLVERHLAKVEVASSSLVIRSKLRHLRMQVPFCGSLSEIGANPKKRLCVNSRGKTVKRKGSVSIVGVKP